jgi:hypothetical protein
VVQVSLGKNIRPYSKRAGGVTQVVEYLHRKCEALNFNPSTEKKKSVV